MKGQARLVSEILIFMVGIAVTVFVIYTFSTVAQNAEEIALKDQMTALADSISVAIVKSTKSVNNTIRLEIPKKLSNRQYTITVDDSIIVSDGVTVLRKEIFNITKSYSIVMPQGSINGVAQYIEVHFTGEEIIIRRN